MPHTAQRTQTEIQGDLFKVLQDLVLRMIGVNNSDDSWPITTWSMTGYYGFQQGELIVFGFVLVRTRKGSWLDPSKLRLTTTHSEQ